MYLPSDQRPTEEINSLEELGFALTQSVLQWLPTVPQTEEFMQAIGVLETVKLEFFRRAAGPHLEEQLKLNADIGYDTLG